MRELTSHPNGVPINERYTLGCQESTGEIYYTDLISRDPLLKQKQTSLLRNRSVREDIYD
jgi:hypothetical protein